MGNDKNNIQELIEEKKKTNKQWIPRVKIDLRRSEMHFRAMPDGEDHELTIRWEGTSDRPYEPEDNCVCFQLTAWQYNFLLAEMERGFWRS